MEIKINYDAAYPGESVITILPTTTMFAGKKFTSKEVTTTLPSAKSLKDIVSHWEAKAEEWDEELEVGFENPYGATEMTYIQMRMSLSQLADLVCVIEHIYKEDLEDKHGILLSSARRIIRAKTAETLKSFGFH